MNDARLDAHDHFLCTRCTLLLDVEPSPARPAGRPTRTRVRGHRVDGRVLTYLGVCRACDGATTATKRG